MIDFTDTIGEYFLASGFSCPLSTPFSSLLLGLSKTLMLEFDPFHLAFNSPLVTVYCVYVCQSLADFLHLP